MLASVLRAFAGDRIREHLVEPGFRFTSPGSGWAGPWDPMGRSLHFAGQGLLALLIAVGLWQLLSAMEPDRPRRLFPFGPLPVESGPAAPARAAGSSWSALGLGQ